MSREININASYCGSRKIFVCKVSEFLSKVAQHFNIKEDEIEIYDESSNRINVEKLKPLMKVEVRTKNNSSSTSRGATNQYASIIQKLRDNTSLTGIERSFLVDLLSGKVTLDTENINTVKLTRNVKLQVDPQNLNSVRSIESQTEKIFTAATSSKRSLETNDVIYESKRLASTEKVDASKAKDLNDKLYNERRDFILKSLPLVILVKEKYPLLFSLAEVRNEIDRIFYDGMCANFLRNVDRYSKHVLSSVRDSDPLVQLTKRKIASFPTKAQKKYALQVGSLLMISSLVHEERGYLKLIDQPVESSNFPYIEAQAKFNDLFFDQHLFKVYVEEHLLCEASNFKEAILCLLGSYYIFNIQYPDANWNTFALLEQVYLERTDTDGLDESVKQKINYLRLKTEGYESGLVRN